MLERKSQASKGGFNQTKRHKGNVHPASSRRELDQLLFDAARMRAVIARSRSRT